MYSVVINLHDCMHEAVAVVKGSLTSIALLAVVNYFFQATMLMKYASSFRLAVSKMSAQRSFS